MDTLKDVFGMPLFPHLYAIPMTIFVGIVIGYFLRGKLDGLDDSPRLPRRPKV